MPETPAPIPCPAHTGHPNGPNPGERWRHIKSGEDYYVLGIAWLEATCEPVVRYTRVGGGKPEWVRTVADWFADNGDGVARFGRVIT